MIVIFRRHLNTNYNVRTFEPDELEFTSCSVPHCQVTRNTLSRWRQAAVKMFKFPKSLPMTLYLCPEADRERWLAELDIDQSKTSISKLAVCSVHFREGLPTDSYPLPTELLTDNKTNEKLEFKGTKPNANSDDPDSDQDASEEDLDDFKFTQLLGKKPKKSLRLRMKKAIQARRSKRQRIPAPDYQDPKAMKIRSKKLMHQNLFGSRIQCRFCKTQFLGTKQYFQHVKKVHLPGITKTDLVQVAQDITEKPILPEKPSKKVLFSNVKYYCA